MSAEAVLNAADARSHPIRVFVSYRRSDTQMAAGRLRESLSSRFGADAIFRDKDSIAGGEDWTKAIDESLSENVVVLALIGPDWLNAKNETGARRLDDPADWNRLELEHALRRQRTVIPVLIDTAQMPAAAQLPESLRALTRMNALKLRDDDWSSDIERLSRVLAQHGLSPRHSTAAAASPSPPRRRATIGVAAAVVVALAAAIFLHRAPAPSAKSVSGSWTMTHFNEDSSKHVGTLTLEQHGDALTGNVEWARKGGSREIYNGSVKQSTVEFEAVGPRGARRLYRGELDSGGNTIQGFAKGGSAAQATWTAVRQTTPGSADASK